MRKFIFEKGKFYHIYNRGVEKRIIFNNIQNYYRFIFQMFACNIGRSAISVSRRGIISAAKSILGGREIQNKKQLIVEEHSPLVDIVAFTLMPNHFHLILRERTEGGISKFMQKLGIAYTMYFNLRNERSGGLLQGKFKAIPIESERYLLALLRYLHINAVGIITPNFKEEIKNHKKISNFLESYQWSSHLDYLGLRNSKLIQKDVFNSFFANFSKKGIKDYKSFILEVLEEKEVLRKEIESIHSLVLEERDA